MFRISSTKQLLRCEAEACEEEEEEEEEGWGKEEERRQEECRRLFQEEGRKEVGGEQEIPKYIDI